MLLECYVLRLIALKNLSCWTMLASLYILLYFKEEFMSLEIIILMK